VPYQQTILPSRRIARRREDTTPAAASDQAVWCVDTGEGGVPGPNGQPGVIFDVVK